MFRLDRYRRSLTITWLMLSLATATAQPPAPSLPPAAPANPYAQPPANPYAQPPAYVPPPGFDPYQTTQQAPPAPLFPTLTMPTALPVIPVNKPVHLVLSGEFIMLRASDAAITNYALPINGPVLPLPNPAVPRGPVADLEYGADPGYRVGVDWIWNDYSRWVATYTSLDLESVDQVAVDPLSPLVLQSLVLHPSTLTPTSVYTDASANGDIELRLLDVEYRRVFVEDWYRADLLVGGRYATLDQRFQSEFNHPAFTDTVRSNVDFEGAGIRFGIRGDWRSTQHGFFIYAQTTTNFLAGEFTGNYTQTNSITGTVVDTSTADDRIVNITDAELGLGWHSPTQRFWLSGGYLFNTWSNVVSNAGLIRSVQQSNFAPVDEDLTFDGFVVRGELRF